ncbi:MAG: type II toxin-antitoxin system VapC family toxin [Vulcanimicrobiaceae bacterium]
MTAIDTNVFIDLLAGETEAARHEAQAVLTRAAQRGALIISPVVYAELAAHPGAAADELDRFLRELHVVTDWELSEEIWRRAASEFREYARRRRAAKSVEPRRLVADFIVGAHAVSVGSLATRDRAFYQRTFPELTILK